MCSFGHYENGHSRHFDIAGKCAFAHCLQFLDVCTFGRFRGGLPIRHKYEHPKCVITLYDHKYITPNFDFCKLQSMFFCNCSRGMCPRSKLALWYHLFRCPRHAPRFLVVRNKAHKEGADVVRLWDAVQDNTIGTQHQNNCRDRALQLVC